MSEESPQDKPPKGTGYCKVWEPWAVALCEASPKLNGTQWALMVRLCRYLDYDKDGNAYAYFPAETLAQELGCQVSTVYKASAQLRKKGLLTIREKPHHGRCVVYNVMPGLPILDKAKTEHHSKKGRTKRHSKNNEAMTERAVMVPSEGAPTRGTEGGRVLTSAPSHQYPPEA